LETVETFEAQRQARPGAQLEGPQGVGAGVPLGELREHGVGKRLHRGGDEDRAEGGELGHHRRVADEVLHLGGEVEGEARKAGVERPRHPEGVARPVQEVGVAEGDVGRAGLGLAGHVLDHRLGRHGEEAAAVDRGDGAMAAEVQAAARGLGVAGRALGAAGVDQSGVAGERR